MKPVLLKNIMAVILAIPFSLMAANEVSSIGEQFGPPEDIDFRNAQPLPLPGISNNESLLPPDTPERSQEPVGSASGGEGSKTYTDSGPANPGDFDNNPPTVSPRAAQGDIGSQAYGTSNHPFNTTRLDYGVKKLSKKQPYRRSGKLFFNIGGNTFICSASMIKPGIVVTAAHCMADFGNQTFYSGWVYIPAYKDGVQPYGAWTYTDGYILTDYFDGSGACAVPGVVCENDVGILVLTPDGSNNYAGNYTGWFGYGWNGFGFTGSGVANGNMTQITTLGYPANLDSGGKNQRTDSYGITDGNLSNNTVIGSNATGGSSGGPWIVNIGKKAITSDTHGTDAKNNIVVGTTSWGYTNQAVKQQGASPFTDTNIVIIVDDACAAYPDRC